jgi:hypothetical protein
MTTPSVDELLGRFSKQAEQEGALQQLMQLVLGQTRSMSPSERARVLQVLRPAMESGIMRTNHRATGSPPNRCFIPGCLGCACVALCWRGLDICRLGP